MRVPWAAYINHIMKFLLALALALSLAFTGSAADQEKRFFELRIYTAAPDKLDGLLARFRDHTVKLFAKHGMENIGYWVPVDNKENKLYYVLAYPSREARDQSWKEFGADPDWKAAQKASEANGRLVTKADSIFLAPTDYSPMVKALTGGSHLYEFREYTATPGKLANLNSRFRDHTTALFSKHGMINFGYWTPTEAKNGAGEKLMYFVAHKDAAAAGASWKGFVGDADWVKAKAASETDGPLTTKDGVKSTMMVPTDFSPSK